MQKHYKNCLLTLLLVCSTCLPTAGQSRLQQFDDHTLEYLAAHRTPGQTKLWLFVSNANEYVDIAIPAGLLVAGVIDNDAQMKRNALYVASTTAATALVNVLIKKLVKRPRPFVTNLHLTAVYHPT